jgi:hypothetical protein
LTIAVAHHNQFRTRISEFSSASVEVHASEDVPHGVTEDSPTFGQEIAHIIGWLQFHPHRRRLSVTHGLEVSEIDCRMMRIIECVFSL